MVQLTLTSIFLFETVGLFNREMPFPLIHGYIPCHCTNSTFEDNDPILSMTIYFLKTHANNTLFRNSYRCNQDLFLLLHFIPVFLCESKPRPFSSQLELIYTAFERSRKRFQKAIFEQEQEIVIIIILYTNMSAQWGKKSCLQMQGFFCLASFEFLLILNGNYRQ